MVRPLVTIGIPTYNRADGFLKQAVKSALRQTYRNIEIIVSDNCSTDNTKGLIKEFEDPRLKYYRHEVNIGAANNFNFCLERAAGVYFLLLHDDDLIDEDLVETAMQAANYSPGVGLIRTGIRLIDSHGQVMHERQNDVVGLSTEDFFLGWFAGKTGLYLCSTLFNTELLKEIGGFQSKHNLFLDVVAEVKLAAKFGRVDVRDIKASFRRHPGEITLAVKVKHWSEDSVELLDLMCNLATENKSLIRREGSMFFSNMNYKWARSVQSPIVRMFAYMAVYKNFNYQHPPPPIRRIIKSRRLSNLISLVKETFP